MIQNPTKTATKTQSIAQPYVQLQIGTLTVAIEMQLCQEMIVVPSDRLTLLPNMPAQVLGLISHRSTVFWVLDLSQLFGLGFLEPSLQEYQIAVLRSPDDVPLGIAVEAVKGVARFSTEEILSPVGVVDPGLIPYLRGCVGQAESMVLVLDTLAITNLHF
jgi:positive phototaxis protein PixI